MDCRVRDLGRSVMTPFNKYEPDNCFLDCSNPEEMRLYCSEEVAASFVGEEFGQRSQDAHAGLSVGRRPSTHLEVNQRHERRLP